jgi:hypothetical protein
MMAKNLPQPTNVLESGFNAKELVITIKMKLR